MKDQKMCKEARRMLRAGLTMTGIFLFYILATLWNTSEIGSYSCFEERVKVLLETGLLVGLIPAYGAAVIELIRNRKE